MVDVRHGHGLLSALEPTGNANGAFLDTDGGGRQATDGGGRPRGQGRGTLVSEALRRSQAGIGAGVGPVPPFRAIARPRTKTQIPRRGMVHWAPWVRIELARSRLLSRGLFEFDEAGKTLSWVHRGSTGQKSLTVASISAPCTLAVLQQQARWVLLRARLREDRLPEIHVQVNDLWPFWEALIGLDITKAPHTMELLHVTLQFASAVVLQFKHALGVPRASEVLSSVMPIVEVPGHGALPSGHANAAAALSTVLGLLLPDGASQSGALRRLAFRVAANREVAGLHYPMDSAAGRLLGETLGAYVASAALGRDTAMKGARFDGLLIDRTPALGDALAKQSGDEALTNQPCTTAPSAATFGEPDEVVAWLWKAASDELAKLASS